MVERQPEDIVLYEPGVAGGTQDKALGEPVGLVIIGLHSGHRLNNGGIIAVTDSILEIHIVSVTSSIMEV